MSREEIVTRLSLKLVNIAASPSEIVHALSMQSVLIELAHRLGPQALKLTPADLFQARDAVRAAIRDNLNTQEVIAIGLDNWSTAREEVRPCSSPVNC
ncbi:MAG: hypothetical protein FDZ69_12350 [Deltaproteobacteria bacterium]|nr:MAG: hypothetical protein FDZ69_12350 [Deltaproteobacteria bacterium]